MKYQVESCKCVQTLHSIHIHFRCEIMLHVFTEK